MKRLLAILSLILGLGLAAPVAADTPAQVVSACGTPNNTAVTGNSYPITMNAAGQLCVAPSSSGSPTTVIGNQTPGSGGFSFSGIYLPSISEVYAMSSGGTSGFAVWAVGHADANSNAAIGLNTGSFNYVFNGTTWDRQKSVQAFAGSAGLGVAAVGSVPLGTPESCDSGNVAAATAACTLATASGRTTYINGFTMSASGATSGLAVTCTVTGVVTGTLHYTFVFPAGVAVGATPLNVNFTPPLAASAVNTTIAVSCPSGGTGNTNATMTANGSLD